MRRRKARSRGSGIPNSVTHPWRNLSGRRTIAVEDFAEVAEVDGFGQMIVRAGLQAGFAVGGKGVAVRAMTGCVARAVFAAAQFAGSLVPVHARHLAILQDQRVVETLQGREGFLAVGHDISIEAATLQVGIPMTQPDVSSEVMWGGRP